MAHPILYSAEDLRELLQKASPLVGLAPGDGPEPAAFVTDLNDQNNMTALLKQPLVTCVLPIRAEQRALDVAERARSLDRVIVSSEHSVIPAGRDPSTQVARYSLSHSRERWALIHSLLKNSAGVDVAVNLGDGGAGIGLYIVLRWAAQLMFKFTPNQGTTVLIKLLKTKRYKTFDSQRAILEIM